MTSPAAFFVRPRSLSSHPMRSSSRARVSMALSGQTMPYLRPSEKPPNVDAGPLASSPARGQKDTYPGAAQAGAGAEAADGDADDRRRPAAAAPHSVRA